MDQRRADVLGGKRHRLGASRHHGVETLVAPLEQETDQIDHGIGVAHGGLYQIRVAQIGLHRMDLADPAHRPQMAAQLRAAHRGADAVAAVGQRPHHVAAEKTRAAEHGDQRFSLALDCHGSRNT